ncbi:MAG TPA: lamin tail domain-containing protein, partial [Polyangiaceae bacterium]
NITLYGDTAHVSEAATMGVNIALGTDWMPSGSSSLLRELACADSFNATYLDHYFSDQQLWQMVTVNAASLVKMDDVIGSLAEGKYADIAIFASHGKAPFRSVIEAEPKDIALVMRAGTVLYGDDAVVAELGSSTCSSVDVCTVAKRVCTMDEVGKSYDDLQTAAGGIYPAFQCGTPMNEPSCSPKRPESVAGSTIYTGTVTAGSDSDGDGIDDATDNCPKIFNPIRPMDNGKQGDADNDGVGDVCDPCPLDASTTTCTTADPNDRDHDGVVNASDNCPDTPNPDQADTDHDGKGDVCDACPSAPNPGSQGCPATIYDVKNGTAVVGSAVHLTNALVTAKGSNGFFVQVKPGDTDPAFVSADNSGLFVFTGASAPALTTAVVGQRVTIDASIANFQGEIELDTITAITANGTVEAPPAPVSVTFAEVATGGTRATTLEGVLVKVGASSVTAVDATQGEFTMTSSSTTLVGDDFLYVPSPALTVGQALNGVTGVLALRQNASKLEPRNAADIELGPPSLAAFSPALAYARVGVTMTAPTFAPSLTVNLSGPAQGATSVSLVSGDTTKLTVPSTVIVADGASSVVVPVTAVAPAADVTVTATLGTGTPVVGHVRVLDTNEGPTTVSLSPAVAAVAPNGTTTITVTLDLPPPANATVSLSATAGGMVPATVTVPANTTSTTFTYTDVASTADVTLTATYGASTAHSTVKVATGANHLVINEVDYDQPGTDGAEFVEIFNPTVAPISLAGMKLYLVNGSNNTVYATVDLSTAPGGSIPSLGYLVISAAGVVTVPSGAISLVPPPTTTPWPASNAVQNGDPDGIALVNASGTTPVLVDVISYGGAMTAVTIPGFASTVSLVEGTATTAKDSNMNVGSLCRSPNGTDTDNANADWKFCTTVTVGAANP